MKIINGMYFLAQAVVVAVVALVVSLVCAIFGLSFSVMFIMVAMMLGIIVLISNFSGNFLSNYIMKKTIENNAEEQGFGHCSTFDSLYGIIKIDVEGGKFAIVSIWNPTQFQVGDAAKIDKIVSDYVKAPLGGTTGVYFQFMYEKTRIRCYTFASSKNPYSLQSGEVLEGQSKADTFAELLKQAKENAISKASA